jgi:hypothetical protein
MICKPRRRAENIGYQLEQMRICQEQRKQLHAARKPRNKAVKLRKSRVGISRRRERCQQPGHKLGKDFAGTGTTRGADAPVMPTPDSVGDVMWIAEPHARERFDGFGVVFDSSENKAAFTRRQRCFAFKQPEVMVLNCVKMMQQNFAERGGVCKTHKASDVGKLVFRFWQAVRLLILDHLQAMFQFSQKVIGLFQIGRGLISYETRHSQRLNGLQCLARAQLRIAAAEN